MYKCRQRCHALRRDISVGRNPIIRQAVPPRKNNDRQIWRKKPQSVLHRDHTLIITGNVTNWLPTFVQLLYDQLGIKALWRARNSNFGLRTHRTTLHLFLCRDLCRTAPLSTAQCQCSKIKSRMFQNIPHRAVTKIETIPMNWVNIR